MDVVSLRIYFSNCSLFPFKFFEVLMILIFANSSEGTGHHTEVHHAKKLYEKAGLII
jgi:hypothetical protein